MAKHLLLVLSNPASKQQEDEFNEWYTKQHIRDVVKIPGIVAATRYVAADSGAEQPPTWKYLAIYEVESDDVAKTFATLNARAGDPDKMPMSDALDIGGACICFYTPITERVTRTQ